MVICWTIQKQNLFPITFNTPFDLPVPRVAKAYAIFHPCFKLLGQVFTSSLFSEGFFFFPLLLNSGLCYIFPWESHWLLFFSESFLKIALLEKYIYRLKCIFHVLSYFIDIFSLVFLTKESFNAVLGKKKKSSQQLLPPPGVKILDTLLKKCNSSCI